MKNEKGFSLTEVLVAMGLLTLFSYISATMLSEFSGKSFSSIESLEQSVDISVLFTRLQRNGLRRHLTISGFTGSSLSSGVNASGLGKAVMPFPNKCADLTSSCPNDTAFLFANVNINKSPFVTAICALSADKIIVDLGYDNLGAGTLAIDGFNVAPINTLVGGKIKIVPNAIVLVMDDPNGALFIATSAPAAFNPLFNAGTGLYGEPRFAANPTCLSMVRDRTKLVEVSVKPYLLSNTGSSTPPDALVLASMGEFPVKLTQARMMSIGRNPTLANHWGVRFCDELFPNNCTNTESLFMDKVGKVDIFEYFKQELGGNAISNRYSIGKSGDCTDGTCKNLNTSSPDRFFGSISEQSVALESTTFSYLKQNYLDKLEFQIEDNSGNKTIIRRYYLESF